MKYFIGHLCLVSTLMLSVVAAQAATGLQPPSTDRSIKRLQNLSELNDPERDYQISLRHFSGVGVAKDLPLALKYMTKAADAGHREAQFNLGNFYNLYQEDYARAAYWWRKSGKAGHPEALYNLGVLLEEKLIPPATDEDAATYYRQAVKQGSQSAAEALAKLQQAPGNKTPEPLPVRSEITAAAVEPQPVTDNLLTKATQPTPALTQALQPTELQESQAKPVVTKPVQVSVTTSTATKADLIGDGVAYIQLYASTERHAVNEMAARKRMLHDLFIVSFTRDSMRWYALMVGRFASVEAARLALSRVPKEFRASQPWVRRIEDIRRLPDVQIEKFLGKQRALSQ